MPRRLCADGNRGAFRIYLKNRADALMTGPRRRDGRVAEGARLESVYTGNRIVGSNPTPSARWHWNHYVFREKYGSTPGLASVQTVKKSPRSSSYFFVVLHGPMKTTKDLSNIVGHTQVSIFARRHTDNTGCACAKRKDQERIQRPPCGRLRRALINRFWQSMVMSALHPIATNAQTFRIVSFVPKGDMTAGGDPRRV